MQSPDSAEAHILSVAEVWLPPPPPSSYEIVEEARHAESPAELQRDFPSVVPPQKKRSVWQSEHVKDCKQIFQTGK